MMLTVVEVALHVQLENFIGSLLYIGVQMSILCVIRVLLAKRPWLEALIVVTSYSATPGTRGRATAFAQSAPPESTRQAVAVPRVPTAQQAAMLR